LRRRRGFRVVGLGGERRKGEENGGQQMTW